MERNRWQIHAAAEFLVDVFGDGLADFGSSGVSGFVTGLFVAVIFFAGIFEFFWSLNWRRVLDGFDMSCGAAFVNQVFDSLDGFDHAGGDAVQLAEDGEVGAVCGIVFAFEEELIQEVFHLEEAELEVDELLDEDVLGGRDRLVFFEQVVDGDGNKVGVALEVGVVAQGVEAMLEGIGGGAWAGGLFCISAVGLDGS